MISNTITSVTYVGTGSQTVFTFPFDYLKKAFVTVQIDYVSLEYGVDYSIYNKELTFLVAPADGAVIDIIRATDSVPLVSWSDASVLKSSDMTLNQMQELHILEEMKTYLYDGKFTYDENDLSAWNALNARIKNVADPVGTQDVVTKGYIEAVKTGFISTMTTTASTCIASLNTKKTEVLASLTSGLTTALSAIGTLRDSSLDAISTLRDDVLLAITTLRDSTLLSINTLKDSCTLYASNASTSATNAAVSAIEAAHSADSIDTATINASIALKAPIASPTFTGVAKGNFIETVQNLGTITTATTLNCNNGSIISATLGASLAITLAAGADASACRVATLFLTNGGSYAVTWNNNIKWDEGLAPTLTTTGVDMLNFVTIDNGTTWYGCLGGVAFA